MKELEDYKWFPKKLRQYQTDYIGFAAIISGIYKPFISYLKKEQKTGVPMFDLCSGSGEPAVSIYKKSGVFSSLTLSDKYPVHAFRNPDASISYYPASVDASKTDFSNKNTYTMFNAFHHLEIQGQEKSVRAVKESGVTAYFVEILEPTVVCGMKIFLGTTVGVLLLMPFVRPFSLGRLFFTYLIPVNIITIAWDGLLSVARSKSYNYYANLFKPLGECVTVTRFNSMAGPSTMIQVKPQ